MTVKALKSESERLKTVKVKALKKFENEGLKNQSGRFPGSQIQSLTENKLQV